MLEWVTCPSCGHKLFKVDGYGIPSGWGCVCYIEVKCHSCKEIILVNVDHNSYCRKVYKREGRK